jgi:hypothetical protein
VDRCGEPLTKTKTLTVVAWPLFYEVKSISNSTYYYPGEHMDKAVLDKICAAPDWEVTICSLDLFGMLPKIL